MSNSTIDYLECTGVDMMGNTYLELSCIYPFLRPFYHSAELYYDPLAIAKVMYDSPWLPVLICVLYMVLVFAGKAYFDTRERLNMRHALAAWNLFLSVFSICGTIRILPAVFHQMFTLTLEENFCKNPQTTHGGGATGLWIQLFVLSKIPELIDTFFIVVHKKPLIFLHWYHHVTVLLYSWFSYVTRNPIGIFFAAMNYWVHSVMYTYYFLMAVKMRPKWFHPMFVTVAQILQMIVATIVTLAGFYFSQNVPHCYIKTDNNIAACVMYGSYLFLFLQFFVRRYLSKNYFKFKIV